MAAQEHDRAVGRDHAALVAAEQVLRVLGRHDQRRAVLATAPRELHEQVAQGPMCAERAHLIEDDVATPAIAPDQLPQPARDDERRGGDMLRRHVAQ